MSQDVLKTEGLSPNGETDTTLGGRFGPNQCLGMGKGLQGEGLASLVGGVICPNRLGTSIFAGTEESRRGGGKTWGANEQSVELTSRKTESLRKKSTPKADAPGPFGIACQKERN